mgnify:CR=1 FL=1
MADKIKKVEELKSMGIEPYGRFFDKKDNIIDILAHGADEEKTFITAGRIVSYRRMGKNGFAHLKDETGKTYDIEMQAVNEHNLANSPWRFAGPSSSDFASDSVNPRADAVFPVKWLWDAEQRISTPSPSVFA